MTQKQWDITKMFMLLALSGIDFIMVKVGAFDLKWHKDMTRWIKDAFEGNDE